MAGRALYLCIIIAVFCRICPISAGVEASWVSSRSAGGRALRRAAEECPHGSTSEWRCPSGIPGAALSQLAASVPNDAFDAAVSGLCTYFSDFDLYACATSWLTPLSREAATRGACVKTCRDLDGHAGLHGSHPHGLCPSNHVAVYACAGQLLDVPTLVDVSTSIEVGACVDRTATFGVYECAGVFLDAETYSAVMSDSCSLECEPIDAQCIAPFNGVAAVNAPRDDGCFAREAVCKRDPTSFAYRIQEETFWEVRSGGACDDENLPGWCWLGTFSVERPLWEAMQEGSCEWECFSRSSSSHPAESDLTLPGVPGDAATSPTTSPSTSQPTQSLAHQEDGPTENNRSSAGSEPVAVSVLSFVARVRYSHSLSLQKTRHLLALASNDEDLGDGVDELVLSYRQGLCTAILSPLEDVQVTSVSVEETEEAALLHTAVYRPSCPRAALHQLAGSLILNPGWLLGDGVLAITNLKLSESANSVDCPPDASDKFPSYLDLPDVRGGELFPPDDNTSATGEPNASLTTSPVTTTPKPVMVTSAPAQPEKPDSDPVTTTLGFETGNASLVDGASANTNQPSMTPSPSNETLPKTGEDAGTPTQEVLLLTPSQTTTSKPVQIPTYTHTPEDPESNENDRLSEAPVLADTPSPTPLNEEFIVGEGDDMQVEVTTTSQADAETVRTVSASLPVDEHQRDDAIQASTAVPPMDSSTADGDTGGTTTEAASTSGQATAQPLSLATPTGGAEDSTFLPPETASPWVTPTETPELSPMPPDAHSQQNETLRLTLMPITTSATTPATTAEIEQDSVLTNAANLTTTPFEVAIETAVPALISEAYEAPTPTQGMESPSPDWTLSEPSLVEQAEEESSESSIELSSTTVPAVQSSNSTTATDDGSVVEADSQVTSKKAQTTGEDVLSASTGRSGEDTVSDESSASAGSWADLAAMREGAGLASHLRGPQGEFVDVGLLGVQADGQPASSDNPKTLNGTVKSSGEEMEIAVETSSTAQAMVASIMASLTLALVGAVVFIAVGVKRGWHKKSPPFVGKVPKGGDDDGDAPDFDIPSPAAGYPDIPPLYSIGSVKHSRTRSDAMEAGALDQPPETASLNESRHYSPPPCTISSSEPSEAESVVSEDVSAPMLGWLKAGGGIRPMTPRSFWTPSGTDPDEVRSSAILPGFASDDDTESENGEERGVSTNAMSPEIQASEGGSVDAADETHSLTLSSGEESMASVKRTAVAAWAMSPNLPRSRPPSAAPPRPSTAKGRRPISASTKPSTALNGGVAEPTSWASKRAAPSTPHVPGTLRSMYGYGDGNTPQHPRPQSAPSNKLINIALLDETTQGSSKHTGNVVRVTRERPLSAAVDNPSRKAAQQRQWRHCRTNSIPEDTTLSPGGSEASSGHESVSDRIAPLCTKTNRGYPQLEANHSAADDASYPKTPRGSPTKLVRFQPELEHDGASESSGDSVEVVHRARLQMLHRNEIRRGHHRQ